MSEMTAHPTYLTDSVNTENIKPHVFRPMTKHLQACHLLDFTVTGLDDMLL